MPKLEAHEIATLFPSMSPPDLDHLRESIEARGQLEEILLFEGKILDGRHRYEACLSLGVEPRLRAFEGTAQDAFAHGVALNLSRRHLTTVQRAAAGAGIKAFQARLMAASAPAEPEAPIDVSIHESEETPAPAPEVAPATAAEPAIEAEPAAPAKPAASPKRINAKARAIASAQSGVSGRVIDAAEKIKHEAPDVFERMLAGTAGSLPDAKRVGALPLEARDKVHALVDEGKNLKAALREVAPPPPPPEGPVFIGKVLLAPSQARAFEALLRERGLERAEAAREALVDWIARHQGAPVEERELVGAST